MADPAQPPETPPATPPPAADPPDPMLAQLFSDLGKIVDPAGGITPAAPTPPQEAPVREYRRSIGEMAQDIEADRAAAAAAPAPDAPATPPAEPAPAVPAVKVTKKAPLPPPTTAYNPPTAPSTPAPEPAPAPVAATPPPKVEAPDEDAEFTPEQRDTLNLAKFAAKTDSAYKDRPAQLRSYFKKVDEYAKSALEKDPDRTLDGDDKDYQSWLKANRPQWSASDERKWERQMLVEETATRVRSEARAETEELRSKLSTIEAKPVVENANREFTEHLVATLSGDEADPANAVLKTAKEKGWEAAEELDPLVAPIVRDVYNFHAAMGQQYNAILHGLAQFDPRNPVHARLNEIVTHQAQHWKEHGGDGRIVNGKHFVTPAEFNQLVRAKDPRVDQAWTFTPQQVLGMISLQGKADTSARVKSELGRYEKVIAKRQPAPKPTVSQNGTKPEDAPSPKARTTISAGVTSASGNGNGQGAFGVNELAILGIPASAAR